MAPWRKILQASASTAPRTSDVEPAPATAGPETGGTSGNGLTNQLNGARFGNGRRRQFEHGLLATPAGQNVGRETPEATTSVSGNLGNSNIGFGNTGNGDIGFGLTGDHQIGFGGFNSGSGNIGFGNSGTGNIGFFNSGSGNMGIGNSGALNTGLVNSGNINTGFGNAGGMNTGFWHSGMDAGTGGQVAPDSAASLASSAGYATGGLSTATMSSGLLNSAMAHTGGLNPAVAGASAYTPTAAAAPIAAPTGFDSGAGANGAGGSAANAALRNAGAGYTGFYSGSNGNDQGVRNAPAREPGLAGSAAGGAGNPAIPKSSFFIDREGSEGEPGLREPVPTD